MHNGILQVLCIYKNFLRRINAEINIGFSGAVTCLGDLVGKWPHVSAD